MDDLHQKISSLERDREEAQKVEKTRALIFQSVSIFSAGNR